MLFVEVAPFMYEARGEIQYFFWDPSNIHLVNFMMKVSRPSRDDRRRLVLGKEFSPRRFCRRLLPSLLE
eukprot:8598953-Pyramimonas_sp.AAC.1